MPNVDLILGADPGRKRSVRTEPTQRRSTQRLDALLDAAAEIVDETGFERLTTQMVAERAGRVDRHGVPLLPRPRRGAARAPRALHPPVPGALSPTTCERSELATWWDVVDVALDALTALYRDEPGFTVVHAGRRETADGDVEPEFAHRMAKLIEAEFDLSGDEVDAAELRFRLGVAIELGDALISRAFERDPAGDERYLAEAKRLVHDYLAEHLGKARVATSAA